MTTYQDLFARLVAFTEDNDTEFAAVAQTVISNGERRLADDIEAEEHIARNQTWLSQTVPGSRYVPKKTAWDKIKWVSLILNDTHTLLEKRTESWLLDYNPWGTTYGVPKFWGDWDDDYFVVSPVPAIHYTMHVNCTAKLTGLSPTTPSTILSTEFPEALLYACLVSAEVFHKSPELVKVYTEQYANALKGAIIRLRGDKFDDLKYNQGSQT